jgi:hypothetical protein
LGSFKDLVDKLIGFIIPQVETPSYEPVTAVTSILKISPDINKMEELVESLFWEDPKDFLNKATVINQEVRDEYKRLMDWASKNTWIAKHDIRNNIYKDFMRNCT